jgi:hypothetical protein
MIIINLLSKILPTYHDTQRVPDHIVTHLKPVRAIRTAASVREQHWSGIIYETVRPEPVEGIFTKANSISTSFVNAKAKR